MVFLIKSGMKMFVVDVVHGSACRWRFSTAKQHLCSKRISGFVIINTDIFFKINIPNSNSIACQVVYDKVDFFVCEM